MTCPTASALRGHMTHRFDTTFHSNGSYTLRCAGLEATTERALARRLVESDMPDGPIEGGRVGHLDWTFPSLHRFAAGAVTPSELEVTPERLHPTLRAAVVALRAAKKVTA